jgi:tetratricopeptide (TPR) repeat protein
MIPYEEVKEELVDEAAKALLETDDYYEMKSTPLVSGEQLKKRHLDEIKSVLQSDELTKTVERGFDWIRQDIVEVLKEEELLLFFNEMSKINEESLAKLPEAAKKMISGGEERLTYQDFFGLGDETLRSMYTLGYQYFERKEFQKAVDVFSVVTTFNPYISDFWNAMALCYQNLKEFQKALDTFSVACETNQNAVGPRISRVECCLNLNLLAQADEEIEVASKLVAANPALDEKWGSYLKSLSLRK